MSKFDAPSLAVRQLVALRVPEFEIPKIPILPSRNTNWNLTETTRCFSPRSYRQHIHAKTKRSMPSPEEISRLQAQGLYPSQEAIDTMYRNSRLNIPAPLRIPMATGAAFLIGMGLGTAHGSKMAGLRFRAEHAHKLPTTTTGWWMYHKSKNYHSAYGGLKEGMRMGFKVSFWTVAMFSIEHMFDTYRGTADLLNTVTACVTVAGGFSLWSE